MNLKKLISVAAAGVLSVSLLSACGNSVVGSPKMKRLHYISHQTIRKNTRLLRL